MFAFDRKPRPSAAHSTALKPTSQQAAKRLPVNPASQSVAPGPRFDFARVAVTPAPVQRKTTISSPDDPFEREADHVADKVMGMAEPAAIGAAPGAIQRECAKCDDEEETKKIHAKRAPSANSEAALDAGAAIRAAERGGDTLPNPLRSYFEPRFGYDLSTVRVHADGEAASAARAVQARAYTFGRNIVFGAGEYAPTTAEGKRLIAHELTHVAQQQPELRRDRSETPAAARSIGTHASGTMIARQTPPQSQPPQDQAQTGQPTQSPAERIVNMHSLLEGSILGDAATQLAQANAILRERCQPRARHVLYVTSDATGGPKVKPMLTLTPQQTALRFPAPENGRAPLMFDPSFFAELTVPTFENRVAEVQTALQELVRWRFDQFAIDAQDLQDEYVETRLRGMHTTDAGTRDLRIYQARTTDTAVRDHIAQILGTTTTIPAGATMGASSTTLRIGTTDVTILPDTTGGSRNHTDFRPDPLAIFISATTHGGVVTSFSGVPTAFRITLQTTYATATGNPETTTSAYGRGSTAADQAAGNTSLRFHESQHGADYLEFLRNNPRPQFTGTVGMPVSSAHTAITTYLAQHAAWLRAMDRFSLTRTDCVGPVTIDTSHAGEVGYHLVCTH
jgi:uncharacterized protein DUF4157